MSKWSDFRGRGRELRGGTGVPRTGITKANLRVGELYSRYQIHEALGGGVQEYLPHKDGAVVCGCFTKEASPDAPEVVLSPAGERIRRWAEVFASQDHAVPVFIKRAPGKWEYVGDYRVKSLILDRADAEQFGARYDRPNTRVVLLLQKVSPPAATH